MQIHTKIFKSQHFKYSLLLSLWIVPGVIDDCIRLAQLYLLVDFNSNGTHACMRTAVLYCGSPEFEIRGSRHAICLGDTEVNSHSAVTGQPCTHSCQFYLLATATAWNNPMLTDSTHSNLTTVSYIISTIARRLNTYIPMPHILFAFIPTIRCVLVWVHTLPASHPRVPGSAGLGCRIRTSHLPVLHGFGVVGFWLPLRLQSFCNIPPESKIIR
jgi:hypothetical protein